MPRLWLIGGTQESRQLVGKLHTHNFFRPCCVVTITSESARSLYPVLSSLDIWVGRLTTENVEAFITRYDVAAILDASHPFAVQISQLAIAQAQQHALPYLRYERPAVNTPMTPWRDRQGRPGLVSLPHVQAALSADYLADERTLLTLGYRYLPRFVAWQSQAALFARILPSITALQTALESGFTPDRLIALRPPIEGPLEKALWQQWQITQVITKASGTAGGQTDKQRIAAELGVRLMQIERPAIAYPQQTDCFDTALQFVLRYCS